MAITSTTRRAASTTLATPDPIRIPACQKSAPRVIKAASPDAEPEAVLWRMLCGDAARAPPDPRDTIAAELWHDLADSIDGLDAEKVGRLCAIAADAEQKNPSARVRAALLKLACGGTEWRPLYYAVCKIYALAVQRQNNRERDNRPRIVEPGGATKIDPRKPRAGRPARYERLEDVFELAG